MFATIYLVGVLLAVCASARLLPLPYSAMIKIHPKGQPNYCLSWKATSSYPEPWTYKLLMERCNGQNNHYWQWKMDEATTTWVINSGTRISACIAANATHTPPQNGDLASITDCWERVNEFQNFRQYSGSDQISVGWSYFVQDIQYWQHMCLDVKDGNYVDGDVQMWQCVDGNTNQKWELEWVEEMWF